MLPIAGGARSKSRPVATMLVTAALVAATLPVSSVNANEPESAYVYVIEEALIEGVEVKGLMTRMLTEGIDEAFNDELPRLFDELRMSLDTAAAIPADSRLIEATRRVSEIDYQNALAEASGNASAVQTQLNLGSDSLYRASLTIQSALDNVSQAYSGADPSTAYSAHLSAALDSLEEAQRQSSARRSSMGDAEAKMLEVRTLVENAKSLPPEDESYLASLDEAVAIVTTIRAYLADDSVDSNDNIASVDNASFEVQHAAQTPDADPMHAEIISAAQGNINESGATLRELIENLSPAPMALDSIAASLDQARDAGRRVSSAKLSAEYRSALGEAEEAISHVLASLNTMGADAVRAENLLQHSEDDIQEARQIDDQDVHTQLDLLQANIQSTAASLQNLGAVLDSLSVQSLALSTSISNILETDILEDPVQKTVFDSLFAVLESGANLMLPPGQTVLSIVGGQWNTAKNLAFSMLGLVSGQVDAAVVAVDNAQGQAEGIAWSYAEVFTDAGVAEKEGDCRVEYKHQDGQTVRVSYGTPNADSCYGWAGADTFWMRAGNDYAAGNNGSDNIHLSAGVDEGRGFADRDFLYGGNHSDQIYGGDGSDRLYDSKDGTFDNDYLSGGPGGDFADMEDFDTDDSFFGGTGKDPEPVFDKNCSVGSPAWGCTYDYFESAGGYSQFPPDP